jgi:hypothetical protein
VNSSTAINMGVQVPCNNPTPIPLGISLGEIMLDPKAHLFSDF